MPLKTEDFFGSQDHSFLASGPSLIYMVPGGFSVKLPWGELKNFGRGPRLYSILEGQLGPPALPLLA